MGFIAKDWDIFVTKKGGKNSTKYDLVAFNPTAELAYEGIVNQSMLTGVDSKGNEYKMLEVSREMFDIIENKLLNKYSLNCGFVYAVLNDKEEENIVEQKGKSIPASIVKKAIKGELSYEELDKIVQVEIEEDDYYDYQAFIEGILRFIKGEVSEDYYIAWTILVSWALNSNKFKLYSKKWKIYDSLAYDFDGHSFGDFEEEKEVECNDMIATLKYKNHLLQNIDKAEVPPFYNKNKTIVYVNFAFCNQSNAFYRVCIANEETEEFKIALVVNCTLLPDVNYTFIDEDEMLDLTNKYYDYCFDPTINEYDYVGSLPFKE